MKRKILTVILAALSAVACALTLSACGEKDVWSFHEVYDDNDELIGYSVYGYYRKGTDPVTELSIPGSYNNKPVISIESDAFRYWSSLTSVKIPDSVTSIGFEAFYYCDKLFQIENGVSYVDKWVIDCDESVSAVNLRADTVGIADYAFSACSSLASIEIPNSVKNVGDYAFRACSSLEGIKIPNGVTGIGKWAFDGCSSLESITIPNSVTSIGGSAFSACSSLTSIEIPNGVTSIGSGAFYNCSSLTSIEIPNGVTRIENHAFDGCSSLTNIEIPNGVTSIGNQAFYGCRGLTSIEIPNSVTSIEGVAFGSCEGLTSIVIPSSVTSIGRWAFFSCSLTIHCEAESKPSEWDDDWNPHNCPVVWGYVKDSE